MAKFIFPMENILSMKEKIEESEKNNYSQKVMILREEEEKYDNCLKRQELAQLELSDALNRLENVSQIKEKEEGLEILKMFSKQQQLQVVAANVEVDKARERLNEAMKERKIYEKLREKAFDLFVKEENQKEQKEIDELVSYRYGLTGETEQ